MMHTVQVWFCCFLPPSACGWKPQSVTATYCKSKCTTIWYTPCSSGICCPLLCLLQPLRIHLLPPTHCHPFITQRFAADMCTTYSLVNQLAVYGQGCGYPTPISPATGLLDYVPTAVGLSCHTQLGTHIPPPGLLGARRAVYNGHASPDVQWSLQLVPSAILAAKKENLGKLGARNTASVTPISCQRIPGVTSAQWCL